MTDSTRLTDAVAQAAPLVASRGWTAPSAVTAAAAERLLNLLASMPRPPAIEVQANGDIAFEWEAGDAGWLGLTVDGDGRIAHAAVIGGDEFAQTEDFGDTLPAWAAELLGRLMRLGH